MPITLTCPHCAARYAVPHARAGKKVRCAKCSTVFVVSEAPSAGAAPVRVPAPPASLRPAGDAVVPEGRGSTPARTAAAEDAARLAEADRQRRVPAEWNVGDVILDLYEVKDVHQGGGMGVVYRVNHRQWSMDLAVKSPRPKYFATDRHKENFVREAETWVNLGLHPHIVSCYYVRTLGGIPRVFAEYVDGGSLADWIRSRKLYEGGPEKALARILDIAIQTAWGLHYAHEKGLVHQDVKPLNVMMDPDGTAKITDFGLANARSAMEAEPGPGTTTESDEDKAASAAPMRSLLASYGGLTRAYCSPEQAEASAKKKAGIPRDQWPKLTRRTDLWSWAVTVFEMFCGEPPCRRGGQLAGHVLSSFLEEGTEDQAIPKMPTEVQEALKVCFEREMENRPRDLKEVAKTLGQVHEQMVGQAYARAEPTAAELLAGDLNNRAVSFLELGDEKKAENCLMEALKVEPNHMHATYNHGLLLWRQGRLTENWVVARLSNMQRSHADLWEPLYLTAWIHVERRRAADAATAFTEARRLAGSDPAVIKVIDAALAEVAASGGTAGADRASYVPLRPRSVAEAESNRRVLLQRCEELSAAEARQDWRTAIAILTTARSLPGYRWHPNIVFLRDRLAMHCGRGRLLDVHHVRSLGDHRGKVFHVSVSPDGAIVASGGTDDNLCVWEISTGRRLLNLRGHGKFGLTFTRGGRLLLSTDADNMIRLWEVATGKCLRSVPGGHETIGELAVTADGCIALDGALNVWDLEGCRHLRRLRPEAPSDVMVGVSITPDGRLAACPCEGSRYGYVEFPDNVDVRDLAHVRRLRSMEGHRGSVFCTAITADGNKVVSGSHDRTMRLWSVGTGQCERVFEGHRAAVREIAMTADGAAVMSAGYDDALRVWDVKTGRCVWTLDAPVGCMFDVDLTPDGRIGVSGGSDGSVQIWRLDWELIPRDPADWDEHARPWIDTFLSCHTPYVSLDPDHKDCLVRRGKPVWTDSDFEYLIKQLQWSGYGWLRPEGVRRELEKMAAKWEGPPPLPGA